MRFLRAVSGLDGGKVGGAAATRFRLISNTLEITSIDYNTGRFLKLTCSMKNKQQLSDQIISLKFYSNIYGVATRNVN